MSGEMANAVEPMDIDSMDSDFDKENSFSHNNMLPCTEKGYEELDVSELNIKLRHSITPTSSPMSKSFTNGTDHKSLYSDDALNIKHDANLTRSLNSTMSKNDNLINSLKPLPLQAISTDKIIDNNNSLLQKLDSKTGVECNDVSLTVTVASDTDERSSLSSTSSVLHTPEATTPTKEIPKSDGGSPIIRGLKSVLNMFRSSQSPIPVESNPTVVKDKTASASATGPEKPQESLNYQNQVLSSTPIPTQKIKESNGSKRCSPYKESIVFNDDLEKELQWKDETTIIFSQEKIPIHKLFFQQPKAVSKTETNEIITSEKLNSTAQYTDISLNDSTVNEKDLIDSPNIMKNENSACNDSDSEFLDCETTLIKDDSQILEKEEEELRKGHVLGEHTLSSDLNTYRAIDVDGKQVNIHNKIEAMDENIPLASTLKVNLNDFEMSLQDINLKKEMSVYESQIPESHISEEILVNNNCGSDDLYLNSCATTQLLNIENNHENTSPLSEKDLKNNMNPEYELDSLEYNVPTMSNIDILSHNNDLSEVKIDGSPLRVSNETIDISVQNANFMLSTEVSFPNVDNNENEQCVTNVLNNSVSDTVEENMKIENVHSEIMKVHPSVSYNNVTVENKLATYEDTCGIRSPKIEQVNDNSNISSIAEVEEEIADFTELNKETVPNPVKCSSKLLIAHKTTVETTFELPENLRTTNLCENHMSLGFINDHHKIVDTSLLQENMHISDAIDLESVQEYDAVLLPNDVQASSVNINNIVEKQLLANEQLINELLYNENNSNIHSDTQNMHEAIVKNRYLNEEMVQELKDNHTELNLAIMSAILQKPVEDEINLSEVNKSVTQTQPSNSFILNEESMIQVNMIGNKQIIEKTMLPLGVTSIKGIEDLNTTLETNKELSEEIENKPKIYTESQTIVNKFNIASNIEFTDGIQSLDIESAGKNKENHVLDIDNTVKANSDNQDIYIKYSSDQCFTKNNAIEEQSHTVLVQKQSDNIIENNNENNLNVTLVKAVKVEHNESITLNNLNTETDPLNNDKAHYKENNTTVPNDKLRDNTESKEKETINADPTLNEYLKTDVIPQGGNSAYDSVVVCDLDTFTLDEEIVLSENNSPYVSVSADLDKDIVEQTSESCVPTEDTNVAVPISNSPPSRSKGYNLNEIDDVISTKTNIQVTPETSKQKVPAKDYDKIDTIEIPKKIISSTRRKSQDERKKLFNINRKLNKTVGSDKFGMLTDQQNIDCSDLPGIKYEITQMKSPDEVTNNGLVVDKTLEAVTSVNNNSVNILNMGVSDVTMHDDKCTNIISNSQEQKENDPTNDKGLDMSCADSKNTSSSDQSYYSAGTSCESAKPRNVYNLPEIDDINFNQFAVMSKICQSLESSINDDSSFVAKSTVLMSSENTVCSDKQSEPQNSIHINFEEYAMKECADKMDTELMEKDTSVNLSSGCCSEKDSTVRHINTEDEDTIEGPFIEAEDPINEKISCTDDENVMQCNDIPAPESEDNAEGELFIDAEAFEFLLNKNKNVVTDSGRESLFLKFDPLFAKLSSDTSFSAHTHIQRRQSTPRKFIKHVNKPSVAEPLSFNVTNEKDANNTTEVSAEDVNVTMSKPMMVVPPALNATVTPRKSITPTRTNRRSVIFTSPAMAVIDRLLSLSTNESLVENEANFVQTRHEQNEADLALTQLRDLLAEKEVYVYNLRTESKDLKERLTVLESRMYNLETESEQRLRKINELMKTVSEKTKENRSMAVVVEEYERTIASLIADTEQDKKQHVEERLALIHERDEQTAHLASMEVSFNDLHSKYEKSKQIILSYEASTELHKKTFTEFEENVTKLQNNYELLKQHATSKLNHANEELQRINRAHETEVLKLNAMIKRNGLHITSLEETLAQKTKANEELTAICDELINKVG